MADALPRVSLGQVGYPVIGLGGRLGVVRSKFLASLLARNVGDGASDGAGEGHDDEGQAVERNLNLHGFLRCLNHTSVWFVGQRKCRLPGDRINLPYTFMVCQIYFYWKGLFKRNKSVKILNIN